MNITYQNSYRISPYWRWWAYYNSPLSHQFMPKRENHDTFKHCSKKS